jgi:hypothetical protein
MSEDPSAITFRVIQELMPEYHIPPDLLGDVFAAIPPPPAAATADWRHARVTRVIEEVAARMPMDAAQGHLAGQIAVFQFLADGMAAQIHAPGLAMLEMYRLTRLADALVQTVSRMERSLKRRQFRVMPFRDVRAVDGFDLDALDAIWCRREWAGSPVSGAGPVGSSVANRVDNPMGDLVEGPVGNPVESPVENPVENPAASPGRHETVSPEGGGWGARPCGSPGGACPRARHDGKGRTAGRDGRGVRRRRRPQRRRRGRRAGPAYRHPDVSRVRMA